MIDYVEEVETGSRGMQIPGTEIDRIIIWKNVIRLYLNPAGMIEFEVKDHINASTTEIAKSVD